MVIVGHQQAEVFAPPAPSPDSFQTLEADDSVSSQQLAPDYIQDCIDDPSSLAAGVTCDEFMSTAISACNQDSQYPPIKPGFLGPGVSSSDCDKLQQARMLDETLPPQSMSSGDGPFISDKLNDMFQKSAEPVQNPGLGADPPMLGEDQCPPMKGTVQNIRVDC